MDDADEDLYYLSETEYEPRGRSSTTYYIFETYENVGSRRRGSRRQTYSSGPTIHEFHYVDHEDDGGSRPYASYNGESSSRGGAQRRASHPDPPRRSTTYHPGGRSRHYDAGESSSRNGARMFSSNPDPWHRYAAHAPGSRSRYDSRAYNGEGSSRNGARRYASNPDPPHRSADHQSGGRSYHRFENRRNPAFFCWPCQKTFSSAEEKYEHRLNSSRHFLCRLCHNDVDYKSVSGLERHYEHRHESLYCEFCAKVYPTEAAKLNHMEANHCICNPCGQCFRNRALRERHWARSRTHYKEYCLYCKDIFPDLLAHMRRFHPRRDEYRSERAHGKSRDHGHGSYREEHTRRENPQPSSSAQRTGVHYVTIGVEPSAHQDDILRAAKKRRIETHPDRLKRKPGLTERQKAKIDEEAAKVGHAADILSDPISRLQYDQDVRAGRAQ